MGYAFISYSSKNRASADEMTALLRKHHIDVWIAPDDIPPGSKYAQVIGRAIKECACMVLLFTNDAQNSSWVPKEVERAINYKKTIIPVQLEDVQLNDEFEMYISTEQIIAVDEIDENSEKIQKVLKSVTALTGQNSVASGKKQPAMPATPTAEKSKGIRNTASRSVNARKAPVEFLCGSPEASVDTEELRETARKLDVLLKDFRVAASITKVVRGAVVTRYEVVLDKSVRLNKLTSLADDIALMLGVSAVRIAVVPGKTSTVGIEVPNRKADTVTLREVVDSPAFTQSASNCSFAVGKDVDGNCIVADIAKLPHLLIAGTAGSGMSVFMNSLILSLLYKASADDVKLVLIDTTKVELAAYSKLPYLLVPRVTAHGLAVETLYKVSTEMSERFEAMSKIGVRDLERYNSAMESIGREKLPRIIVIINELADLMQPLAQPTEKAICRIAQLGRAAGIHLILATQRISTDVITGLIKANIPSRIAFSLSSPMESRTILDMRGAEKLLGHGDMLYAPIGNREAPLRVQGCFTNSQEIKKVVAQIKNRKTKEDNPTVVDNIPNRTLLRLYEDMLLHSNAVSVVAKEDPMFPEAVALVTEIGSASAALLQRRLKLGYARASRIIDQMEARGIVGPHRGSQPREVFMTKEQWDALNGNAT